MRKSICDLTRQYFSDVVEIEDHATCHVKVVGQRTSGGPRQILQKCATQAREIPGIGPHIFLWTHSGKQEKARVGLSRENKHEAMMACGLAAYLVECGVPRASIAILTPYKGQLMLMRSILFKDKRFLKLRLISRDQQEQDVIRISTVDRFQGDEEDVVICSLVVDEKSKTSFVKLVNRMIVLLSRARLGFTFSGMWDTLRTTGYQSTGGPPLNYCKSLLSRTPRNFKETTRRTRGCSLEVKSHSVAQFIVLFPSRLLTLLLFD
jgi:AAA domain